MMMGEYKSCVNIKSVAFYQNSFPSGVMMMICQYILLLSMILTSLLLLLPLVSPQLSIDLSQDNKRMSKMSSSACNKDSVITFSLSSSTTFSCTSSTCSTISGGNSNLKFLDANGNDLYLTLNTAQIYLGAGFYTNGNISPAPTTSIVLDFSSGSNSVEVIVPILFTLPTISSSQRSFVVDLSSSKIDSALSSFAGMSDSMISSGVSLSAFNFLNMVGYSSFFTITNSQRTVTALITTTAYYFNTAWKNGATTTLPTVLASFSGANTTLNGDRLCWASSNGGAFQTHMRESIPLWFAWVSVLLFWLYNLISKEVSPECYQRSFKDNKWTCWSLYSIFWLAHEDCFTKLSRTTLFYITIIWQGLVLSAIYSTVGSTSNQGTIIWAALVAYAASVPFPHFFGRIFLKKIYAADNDIMETQLKIHGLLDKPQVEILQKQAHHLERRRYGFYYAYYAIMLGMFVVFNIVSVTLMQQPARQFYYLHFYWLASMGIVLVFDHLIVEPILTALLGHTRFYRNRGYFYDFSLIEKHKQLQ